VPNMEMPFYFDQRGEINRDSMVEEVAHSVHGANLYTANKVSRIELSDGRIMPDISSVERGASDCGVHGGGAYQTVAMDSPMLARGGAGVGIPLAGQRPFAVQPPNGSLPSAANHSLISNELLSMKLDLVLQAINQQPPAEPPSPTPRSSGARAPATLSTTHEDASPTPAPYPLGEAPSDKV